MVIKHLWYEPNTDYDMDDEFEKNEFEERSAPNYCQFEHIDCEFAINEKDKDFQCEKINNGTYESVTKWDGVHCTEIFNY